MCGSVVVPAPRPEDSQKPHQPVVSPHASPNLRPQATPILRSQIEAGFRSRSGSSASIDNTNTAATDDSSAQSNSDGNTNNKSSTTGTSTPPNTPEGLNNNDSSSFPPLDDGDVDALTLSDIPSTIQHSQSAASTDSSHPRYSVVVINIVVILLITF